MSFPEIFSRHAELYRQDRMGSGAIPLARRELVQALNPQPGESVLDLACGPGTITLPMAGRVGPEGRVVAGDLAAGMLDLLREAAPGNVEVRELDIERPDVEAGAFDVVACAHGYQFIADLDAAFAGARRALRRGGRFGFTVPGRGHEHALIEVTEVLEALPWVETSDQRRAVLATLDDPDELVKAVRTAGFDGVQHREVVETFRWPDAATAYAKLVTNWRAAEALSRLSPQDRTRAQVEIRAALARARWPVSNRSRSVLVTATAA